MAKKKKVNNRLELTLIIEKDDKSITQGLNIWDIFPKKPGKDPMTNRVIPIRTAIYARSYKKS
ncbi:hypothetical protein EV07_0708 [Prochlorococcus sp. MIT 0603]|nr:hypothetical protein EV07_0708 [Prochlorococcus sp. MIT 0603]